MIDRGEPQIARDAAAPDITEPSNEVVKPMVVPSPAK
jgi:hypothetical protein